MNVKRTVIVILLFALFAVVLSGCSDKKEQLKNALIPYTEMLQNGKVSELEMTIHYISPAVLTLYPWGADNLKSCSDARVVTVSGEELSEQTDLLKELSAENLQLTSSECLNARFCCEFSNASGDVLLVLYSLIIMIAMIFFVKNL